MIPRIFEGSAVAVVAGGPSLTEFDFSRLAYHNVVAINRAHEVLPRATLLWWSDAGFFRQNREALIAHRAPWKATCQLLYVPDELPLDIHVYTFTGTTGFDDNPANLCHGNNSTFAAIHLSAHLGAARIILFGLDMRYGPGGETHYHGGHIVDGKRINHTEDDLRSRMLPWFGSIAQPLADRGIEVLNASPDSALKVWPRCTIDEGVAALHG